MNMRSLIAMAAFLAAAQSVHAEDNAPSCKTWDDISARCILAQPTSPFAQGYVAGLRDGIFMQSKFKTTDGVSYLVVAFVGGEKACLPAEMPVGFETLVGAVRSYLFKLSDEEKSRNLATHSLDILLPGALSQTYLCPSSLSQ